jgi:hypothetical protein
VSWARRQYRKEVRPVRHARVALSEAQCVDCGCALHVTHVINRFGLRCRSCWRLFFSAAGGEEVGSLQQG